MASRGGVDRRMEPAADPVARLVGELEAMAPRFRERLADRALPRELRSRLRGLLADVFRVVETAPPPGDKGRREWSQEARPLLARGRGLDEEIARHDAPPRPFYARGRLGVIRVVEPVRIRFVVGRLGVAQDFERFTVLRRFLARVDWLWERLRKARPDLFEAREEAEARKAERDENELVWGRVTR